MHVNITVTCMSPKHSCYMHNILTKVVYHEYCMNVYMHVAICTVLEIAAGHFPTNFNI